MRALNLNRACRMMDALGGKISRMGEFWRLERAKICFLPCNPYLRSPEFSLPADTQEARAITNAGATHVLLVLCARNIAQVVNTVISAIAILVVDLAFRPDPVRVKPSQPVGKVETFIYSDEDIPVVPTAPDYGTRLPTSPSSSVFGKHARLRVVVQKFAQTLYGKICLSHDALQLLIGQRPASVSALSGLRYFIPALSFAQRQTPNVSDGLRLAIYQWASPRLTGFFRPQWGIFSLS